MTQSEDYSVILFDSVSQTMKAEKILIAKEINHKIIPVPKQISSDCGVCIRIDSCLSDVILAALKDQVNIRELRSLQIDN